jgi:hypothetical protein
VTQAHPVEKLSARRFLRPTTTLPIPVELVYDEERSFQ